MQLRTFAGMILVALFQSVSLAQGQQQAGLALDTSLGLNFDQAAATEGSISEFALAFAQDQPGEVAIAPVDSKHKPASASDFSQGSWVGQMYGSVSMGRSSEVYQYHIGVGYNIWDDISFNFEGALGYTDSGRSGGEDGGFSPAIEIFFRWHFLNQQDWSVFADVGVGLIWFNNPFPKGGTHQNFTPQAGIGFTYKLKENLRLLGGFRWHHISNATKRGVDNNPSYDGIMFYVGAMMPF